MSAVPALLRKELRPMAAVWLAIVAGILAGELPRHELRDGGPLFYVFGALALGATSMGFEYRHGTLAQLLSQPVSRAKVLGTKLVVLALLLAALVALAAAVVFPQFDWNGPDRPFIMALVVLAPLYGFVVAPWLTLTSGNTLAGTLFSGALGGMIFFTGDRIATLRGLPPHEFDTFRLTFVWIGSWLLLAWAAVSLWRSFATLEAPDGMRADLRLPDRLRRARSSALTRRHPLLHLAAKELRLQQLTLITSLLYVALYLMLLGRDTALFHGEDALIAATVIHGVTVCALAGALSCAGERVLGTLQWQLLQPVSMRAQFAVKVAVTFAMVVVLAFGLPVVLAQTLGGISRWHIGPSGQISLMLALFLAGSMYLSSVSSNAMTAFMLCVPAFFSTAWFMHAIVNEIARRTFLAFHPLPREGRYVFARPEPAMLLAAGAVFVVLILALAFANHRDANHSLRRAALQIAALAALVTATYTAMAAAGRFPYF